MIPISAFPGPDRFHIKFLTMPHFDKSRCKYHKPIKSYQGGPTPHFKDLSSVLYILHALRYAFSHLLTFFHLSSDF